MPVKSWKAILLLLLLSGFRGSAAAEVIGRVIEASGTVEARLESSAAPWRAIAAGDDVHVSDTVRTGPQSRAHIFFVDESELGLGAETTIVLEQFLLSSARNFRESAVRVIIGRLRFHLRRRFTGASSFEVRTPTAIAGAKGTAGTVLVPDSQTTILVMDSGEMEVRSSNPLVPGVAFVTAGYSITIGENEAPSSPLPTLDEDGEVPPPNGDDPAGEPVVPPDDDFAGDQPGAGGLAGGGAGFDGIVQDQPRPAVIAPLPGPPPPPQP